MQGKYKEPAENEYKRCDKEINKTMKHAFWK